MKMIRLLALVAIMATFTLTGCKPKDADIKTAIETKLNSDPDLSAVMVNVSDGVATLSGELQTTAAKARIQDLTKDVKGVKSVTDNTTVALPPVATAPPVIAADDPLTKGVTDATKDHPTVKATVQDGVVTVTGTIAADKWKKLKMTLDGLNPKKVDGSALTIK
ncbi:MAG: BON domain-containing protein [Ferruginibacter sp.]